MIDSLPKPSPQLRDMRHVYTKPAALKCKDCGERKCQCEQAVTADGSKLPLPDARWVSDETEARQAMRALMRDDFKSFNAIMEKAEAAYLVACTAWKKKAEDEKKAVDVGTDKCLRAVEELMNQFESA